MIDFLSWVETPQEMRGGGGWRGRSGKTEPRVCERIFTGLYQPVLSVYVGQVECFTLCLDTACQGTQAEEGKRHHLPQTHSYTLFIHLYGPDNC